MSDEQTQQKLAKLRSEIDQIDQQLVELLSKRAEVVYNVGQAKQGGQAAPIYAPEREQKVLQQVREWNKGRLSNQCLEAIWRELMSGSFAIERPLRIGFLGPQGSFSQLAARRKFGASVEYDDLRDIQAVFEEQQRGHIDYGLVPIENSSMGGIGETLDCFLNFSAKITAEVLIRIHHNLMSKSSPHEIKRIYSKPEVLAQTRKWLGDQYGHCEVIPVASSSKAAEIASQEPGSAAIGSVLAAEIYDLKILVPNIEDNPNNTTRFFVIGNVSPNPGGEDKTALMFTTAHKAGALSDVLRVFQDYGLNLTHIDKRPSQQVNWEYYFFVDLLGHLDQPAVRDAIREAERHCNQLKVLGSFPKATDVLE